MSDAPAKEKKASKPRPKPEHPPYSVLITEAIAQLKERNGSSLPALKKAIGEKYGSKLKGPWEKTLSHQLKKLTEAGKLVKVKASYKLGEDLKKATKKAAPKKPRAPKEKKEGEEKPKKAAPKPKAEKPKKPASEKKAAKPKKPASEKKAAAPKPKKAAAPKVKKSPTKKAAPKKAAAKPKSATKKAAKPKAAKKE